MLKLVKRLMFHADYPYAPPVEEAAINLKDVAAIVPKETKRPERCVEVRMRDGMVYVCVGQVGDFLEPSPAAPRDTCPEGCHCRKSEEE